MIIRKFEANKINDKWLASSLFHETNPLKDKYWYRKWYVHVLVYGWLDGVWYVQIIMDSDRKEIENYLSKQVPVKHIFFNKLYAN